MNSSKFSISYAQVSTALKSLARTIYWQSTYAHFKEGNLQLFCNTGELTSIQVEFLYLLGFYYNVITDVGAGVVSDKVLKSDTRIEAYCFYKNKKIKNDQMKTNQDSLKNKMQNNFRNQDQWVFKTPKK